MCDQKPPEKSIVAAASAAETSGFKPFMEVIPPHMFMDPQRGTRGFEIGVRWNYENPTGDYHPEHHSGYGPRSMPLPQPRSLGPFRPPPPMMMGYRWQQPPPRYMAAPPPTMHHRYGQGGSPYHHHHHQHVANYNYYGSYEYEYEYPSYGQHAAYYGGYY